MKLNKNAKQQKNKVDEGVVSSEKIQKIYNSMEIQAKLNEAVNEMINELQNKYNELNESMIKITKEIVKALEIINDEFKTIKNKK